MFVCFFYINDAITFYKILYFFPQLLLPNKLHTIVISTGYQGNSWFQGSQDWEVSEKFVPCLTYTLFFGSCEPVCESLEAHRSQFKCLVYKRQFVTTPTDSGPLGAGVGCCHHVTLTWCWHQSLGTFTGRVVAYRKVRLFELFLCTAGGTLCCSTLKLWVSLSNGVQHRRVYEN